MNITSETLKVLSFALLFIILSSYFVYASSESQFSKIDSDLLNVQGETSVIIEFSQKSGNYKQFIKSLGGRIVYDYDSIEGVAIKIDGRDISKLSNLENLLRVHKDREVRALLHDSAPMISADQVWSLGYTGKDVKVCIIDTGVNYRHPKLGSCEPLIMNGNVEPYFAESPYTSPINHYYPVYCNNTTTITRPGYTSIAVHFTNISVEKDFDFIRIKDKNGNTVQTFTGDYKDVWTVSIPGDTLIINLVSDGFYCSTGYYVDKVINGSISFGFDNCDKVIAGHDFFNNDNDPMDDNGHGTHVAGIISSDDSYSRGIANGTKIMVAKVLGAAGSGLDSDVIAGIDWCINNSAQIISMSLGGDEYNGTCDDDPVANATNNAVDRGVAVVVAAGNSGKYGLTTPSCASKAIAVGAVDKNKNVIGFSSKGSELDIVAPGQNINSTISGGWRQLNGTSMAAPHVSGVISLMLEAKPSLTVTDVKRILRDTSDPVNKCYECTWSNGNCINHYGSEIDCNSNATGSGIVNASRAVVLAENDCSIKVQYWNGTPLNGADVWIVDGELIGTTNSNGQLGCDQIIPGSYRIKALYNSVQFGPDATLNTPGSVLIVGCTNDEDCNDDNVCTIDACYNPGQSDNRCEHSNEPDGTDCGTCCSCFSGNKNYDSNQNDDCKSFNLPEIATCTNVPDSNPFTWDYRHTFNSQCIGLEQCSQINPTLTHSCNKTTCGAPCEQVSDCSDKCVDKKWYSTHSCNSQCACNLNNLICSVGHCGAECDGPEDCASGICNSNCTCFLNVIPPKITILSPLNKNYNTNITWANVTLDKVGSWCGRSLDNGANVTMTYSSGIWYNKMTGLTNGNHTIRYYCIDTSGNMGTNITQFFYCYADVTGDRTVNLRDVAAVIQNFNYNCGNPKYNSTYDINDDCSINMKDINIAILNFNKLC